MKTKIITITLAAAFLVATVTPAVTEARRGGGNPSGQSLQTQTKTLTQDRDRIRLRDGSCTQSASQTKAGAAQQKGNTYGSGDGTGNAGIRPQNGTGYGAPANR